MLCIGHNIDCEYLHHKRVSGLLQLMKKQQLMLMRSISNLILAYLTQHNDLIMFECIKTRWIDYEV